MKLLPVVLLVLLCTALRAQARHDPLTAVEVEQMRDSAQNPKRRIDLLLGFARERMVAVEQLRSTVNASPNANAKQEELLGDFSIIIDELDDNLAEYNKRGEDLRPALRHVLDTESEFQQKLKALADQSTPQQMRWLAPAVEDASESLQGSTESTNAVLAAQVVKKGEEKSNATKQSPASLP